MAEQIKQATAAAAIPDTTIVSTDPENVCCDLAGEAIILAMKSGTYFGLNSVGARVWNLLSQPRSFGEVCQLILDEYDVTPEQCRRDLTQLFQRMAERGLVRLEK